MQRVKSNAATSRIVNGVRKEMIEVYQHRQQQHGQHHYKPAFLHSPCPEPGHERGHGNVQDEVDYRTHEFRSAWCGVTH